MKRLRIFTLSDHEQMLHDDRRRLADQCEFSRVQMALYDKVPKIIRDQTKNDTAALRRYYGRL